MIPKIIDDFVESMNNNAPLNSGTSSESKYINYKYPYKPILVLSIIKSIKSIDDLFNKDIILDINSPIIKCYYDILTNSSVMMDFLKKHKGKEAWFDIFNNDVQKQVVTNIFENPAIKLKADGFWSVNKKDKSIKMMIEANEKEKIAIRNYLENQAYLCLGKCIPEYKDLSINEIYDYKEYLRLKLLSEKNKSVEKKIKQRQYQHIFSKIIFERDQKCMICCLELPTLLQACHIKRFADCQSQLEQYDENNGILLCCNHHKLFDAGLFTLNIDGTIKISKLLSNVDNNLLIKQYEPCYKKTFNATSWYYSYEYINWHQNNVFKK